MARQAAEADPRDVAGAGPSSRDAAPPPALRRDRSAPRAGAAGADDDDDDGKCAAPATPTTASVATTASSAGGSVRGGSRHRRPLRRCPTYPPPRPECGYWTARCLPPSPPCPGCAPRTPPPPRRASPQCHYPSPTPPQSSAVSYYHTPPPMLYQSLQGFLSPCPWHDYVSHESLHALTEAPPFTQQTEAETSARERGEAEDGKIAAALEYVRSNPLATLFGIDGESPRRPSK